MTTSDAELQEVRDIIYSHLAEHPPHDFADWCRDVRITHPEASIYDTLLAEYNEQGKVTNLGER